MTHAIIKLTIKMSTASKFLVYENWQAEKKAVVHKSNCGHAREGVNRLSDYTAPNDRWFGPFEDFSSASAFAILLPDRQFKLCGVCLKSEKKNISN